MLLHTTDCSKFSQSPWYQAPSATTLATITVTVLRHFSRHAVARKVTHVVGSSWLAVARAIAGSILRGGRSVCQVRPINNPSHAGGPGIRRTAACIKKARLKMTTKKDLPIRVEARESESGDRSRKLASTAPGDHLLSQHPSFTALRTF